MDFTAVKEQVGKFFVGMQRSNYFLRTELNWGKNNAVMALSKQTANEKGISSKEQRRDLSEKLMMLMMMQLCWSSQGDPMCDDVTAQDLLQLGEILL